MREIRSWLMDMDGVLVREEQAIPGADRFLARLREREIPFMVLTNNSIYSPRDLVARLRLERPRGARAGDLDLGARTARFLEDQRPGGSAYVIGESGLTTALHSRATRSMTAPPTTSSSARPAPTPSSASPARSG